LGTTWKRWRNLYLSGYAYIGGDIYGPDEGDLELTAGWGHAGKAGVTMPGRGRIEPSGAAREAPRDPTFVENVVGNFVDQGTDKARDKARDKASGGLDIYLNDVACWRNVPQSVWDFTIGGYQVIKKWLSYREKPILGRSLLLRSLTPSRRRCQSGPSAKSASALRRLCPAARKNMTRTGRRKKSQARLSAVNLTVASGNGFRPGLPRPAGRRGRRR